MGLHDELKLYPGLAFLFSMKPSLFQQLNCSLEVSDVGDWILELRVLKRHEFGKGNEALTLHFVSEFIGIRKPW